VTLVTTPPRTRTKKYGRAGLLTLIPSSLGIQDLTLVDCCFLVSLATCGFCTTKYQVLGALKIQSLKLLRNSRTDFGRFLLLGISGYLQFLYYRVPGFRCAENSKFETILNFKFLWKKKLEQPWRKVCID